jgi:hypothetical protein
MAFGHHQIEIRARAIQQLAFRGRGAVELDAISHLAQLLGLAPGECQANSRSSQENHGPGIARKIGERSRSSDLGHTHPARELALGRQADNLVGDPTAIFPWNGGKR